MFHTHAAVVPHVWTTRFVVPLLNHIKLQSFLGRIVADARLLSVLRPNPSSTAQQRAII
jgi:hypothetical protein